MFSKPKEQIFFPAGSILLTLPLSSANLTSILSEHGKGNSYYLMYKN